MPTLYGGSCVPERDGDVLLVTQQAPSLSTGQHLSVGALASSGGVCCSHLPSSAQILISTSSLPLLALPWRPLWIFPRQTFLRGLSAHVQLRPPPPPGEGGTPGTTRGSEGSCQIPWAAVGWEQVSGREWEVGTMSSHSGLSGGGKEAHR